MASFNGRFYNPNVSPGNAGYLYGGQLNNIATTVPGMQYVAMSTYPRYGVPVQGVAQAQQLAAAQNSLALSAARTGGLQQQGFNCYQPYFDSNQLDQQRLTQRLRQLKELQTLDQE